MRFRTKVELGGKTATGIEVPDDVISALAGGKRPAVLVSIGRDTYRSTVASMGGRYLVPLSAENRAAAGVAAGEDVEVDIMLDTAPRAITVPADLADALAHDEQSQRFFDSLAYTHRKEWVRWVEEAKKADTRHSRISKTVDALHQGKRTR